MRFDGSEPETCRRCGFDSRWWVRRDASAVFERLGDWWRLATVGVEADDLNRRPDPDVWSVLEYGLHSAMVLPILRNGIEMILAQDGAEVRDPCPDVDIEDATRPLTLDPVSILEALEREGVALSRLVDTRGEGWAHLGRMDDGTWWQAEATLMHIAHDTTHHFLDVGEGLARIGAALPTASAVIESVDVCEGGVSSLPVLLTSLPPRGGAPSAPAGGDNNTPPFQMVCLWSSEPVAARTGRGHPLGAGAASANLTLSGADWARLRPATRLLAGTALLELSYPAIPDSTPGRRFSDGDISGLPHDEHPEWAGWYGWVRTPGVVRPGDVAVISPV